MKYKFSNKGKFHLLYYVIIGYKYNTIKDKLNS